MLLYVYKRHVEARHVGDKHVDKKHMTEQHIIGKYDTAMWSRGRTKRRNKGRAESRGRTKVETETEAETETKTGGESLEESLQKKYIPMTETTYYTLLSVTVPRHGYAIMQYVSELTKGRIVLGTGTLYTMVGRLVADGIIVTVPNDEGKKAYQITDTGFELLKLETARLEKQLADGVSVLEQEGAEHE